MDAESRVNRFRHDALLYAGIEQFLHGTLDFIRQSLAADERILAMVGAEKIRELQGALGADADRVDFLDVEVVGRNPARMFSEWRALLDARSDASRKVRGLGEPVWAARATADLGEAQRHEVLLNRAFAETPGLSLLCAYDTNALGGNPIDHARSAHEFVVERGVRSSSTTYGGSPAIEVALGGTLPPPAIEADVFAFDERPLHVVRAHVAEQAARGGLPPDRIEALVLAVDEVASNSIRHGGAGREVRTWIEDDALICEVRDGGRIRDPLVGCFKPPATQKGGRGLWLANQLCDLVQIRSSESGTVVRMFTAKS